MQWLWKWLMILFSGMLLLAGLITFPLPLPIGLPLLIIGLAIMVRHSSDAKRMLVKLSKRFPRLQRILLKRKAKSCDKTAEDSID
jgi:hypothetical protein